MDIRSYLLIVQNLLSTERNELLLSKIDWIIVQRDLIIVQVLMYFETPFEALHQSGYSQEAGLDWLGGVVGLGNDVRFI